MVEEEVNKEKKEEEISKGEKEEERRRELTLEADFTLEPGQVNTWFFLIQTPEKSSSSPGGCCLRGS